MGYKGAERSEEETVRTGVVLVGGRDCRSERWLRKEIVSTNREEVGQEKQHELGRWR